MHRYLLTTVWVERWNTLQEKWSRQRRTSTMCWLIISTGLVAPARCRRRQPRPKLKRNLHSRQRWYSYILLLTSSSALFYGQSLRDPILKDDKPPTRGPVQTNPSTKPATIHFQQKKGALSGEGILEGDLCRGRADTLTTCDNAPNLKKGCPAFSRGKKRVSVCSHYV